MEGLKPYITFSGNCEEAMNYYKEKLNGDIATLMHFGDGPMDVPQDYKNKVMHSEFTFSGGAFMGSDPMPGKTAAKESNITLSVGTTDLKKTEQWFNNLAADGKVTMPLQDTFWGAKFGSLTDKFGITWMFNCEQKK